MKTAIRKHLPDFLAILGLLIVAAAVSTVILGKQRLALPAWVPLVGEDFFEIEAEMSTAQAVTPGQGQTVNIAGVQVGEIASVTAARRQGDHRDADRAEVRPDLQGRVGPAAPEDRPEGHGGRADAGHRGRPGSSRRGG